MDRILKSTSEPSLRAADLSVARQSIFVFVALDCFAAKAARNDGPVKGDGIYWEWR